MARPGGQRGVGIAYQATTRYCRHFRCCLIVFGHRRQSTKRAYSRTPCSRGHRTGVGSLHYLRRPFVPPALLWSGSAHFVPGFLRSILAVAMLCGAHRRRKPTETTVFHTIYNHGAVCAV